MDERELVAHHIAPILHLEQHLPHNQVERDLLGDHRHLVEQGPHVTAGSRKILPVAYAGVHRAGVPAHDDGKRWRRYDAGAILEIAHQVLLVVVLLAEDRVAAWPVDPLAIDEAVVLDRIGRQIGAQRRGIRLGEPVLVLLERDVIDSHSRVAGDTRLHRVLWPLAEPDLLPVLKQALARLGTLLEILPEHLEHPVARAFRIARSNPVLGATDVATTIELRVSIGEVVARRTVGQLVDVNHRRSWTLHSRLNCLGVGDRDQQHLRPAAVLVADPPVAIFGRRVHSARPVLKAHAGIHLLSVDNRSIPPVGKDQRVHVLTNTLLASAYRRSDYDNQRIPLFVAVTNYPMKRADRLARTFRAIQ